MQKATCLRSSRTGDKLDSNLGYEPIERKNLLKAKGEKLLNEKRKFE